MKKEEKFEYLSIRLVVVVLLGRSFWYVVVILRWRILFSMGSGFHLLQRKVETAGGASRGTERGEDPAGAPPTSGKYYQYVSIRSSTQYVGPGLGKSKDSSPTGRSLLATFGCSMGREGAT